MNTYKIWINSKEFKIVMAECPSKAIEKTGHKRIWKIQKIDKQKGEKKMFATIKIIDKASEKEGTERNCHYFYCKCSRINGRIIYSVIGLYYDEMHDETPAWVGFFNDDVNAALDELDRLNQLLNEAKKQIDILKGGSL